MKIGPPPPPFPPPLQGASRAAGFEERGMFGLSRPLAEPATTAPPAPHTPRCPTPQPELETKHPPKGDRRPPVVTTSVQSLLPPVEEATTSPVPETPRGKSGPGDVCSLPEEATVKSIEIGDCAGPEARIGADRPEPRRTGPRPQVSLTLREENGAVEIVAGSAPIDPELRVQLRRLVEAILARSGLALAKFQLNGALLAPDSLGRSGGTHGTRSH